MNATESGAAADLQEWIDRLSQAVRVGDPLELAGSGSVDPADAHSWGPDRCIPAAALRHVVTCSELTVDPRGLRISGARFREELDLAHIAFPHPLHFKDCVFDSLVDLSGAALKELSFEGCHTQQVELGGAEITGVVFAKGLEADGAVDASGVHIGGLLVLSKAKLRNADGALSLWGAEITGSVLAEGLEAFGAVHALAADIGGLLDLREAKLRNADGAALNLDGAQVTVGVAARGLEADGEVRAPGARFGGQLDLREAKLRNADGAALNLDGAQVTVGVAARGLEADGEVRAVAADIGGLLLLSEAKLRNADGAALNLDSAEITGSVFAEGLEAFGAVRALAADIGGLLVLSEAKLRNADGAALNLHGAEITGGVFADGLEADGEVGAIGVHIGGQLGLRRARLRNADGAALSLHGAEITGGVFADGLEADGEVGAIGVHVGGQLGLRRARLRNADGSALSLDGAEITGGVFAGGLEADGAVRAPAADIGGLLELREAKLRNADGAAASLDDSQVVNRDVIGRGCALILSGANVSGEVRAQGLEADGEVRAVGARFDGQLELRDAKLRNADGNGLNLESASIKRLTLGSVDIADPLGPVDITGKVRLYRAAISDLETDANPPSPLVATGWEVTDIHGPLRSDWAAARRWLETTTETSVQPWHALANVYERNGQPAESRRLRFAAANRVAKNAPWRTKLMLTTYRYLVGHGYYPLRAFWWLVGVVLVATLIVFTNRADFIPTNSKAAAEAYTAQIHKPAPSRITAEASCHQRLDYPCLNPFTYTVSAVVPTFGNMTSDWTIPSDATNWLTIALPMLKLTAWALTALLAAGVTGILRKT